MQESKNDNESDGPEDKIRKISKDRKDFTTNGDTILSLRQRLENIHISTRLNMILNIGRVMRHLRDRPEQIGNIA